MAGNHEDLDRVVSRRVRHPTEAGPGDQDTYDASGLDEGADERVEGSGTIPGGAAERAAREPDHDDEPTRTE